MVYHEESQEAITPKERLEKMMATQSILKEQLRELLAEQGLTWEEWQAMGDQPPGLTLDEQDQLSHWLEEFKKSMDIADFGQAPSTLERKRREMREREQFYRPPSS